MAEEAAVQDAQPNLETLDDIYELYGGLLYPQPKAEVLHPFTSYNKMDDASTLVGNWVEERHLKDLTGTIRCGAKGMEEGTSNTVYATRVKAPEGLATHPRVIEHLSQLNPADWASTYKVAHGRPNLNAALLEYKNMPNIGPRERMELAQLLMEAHQLTESEKEMFKQEMEAWDINSTQRVSYQGVDVTGMQVGSRVMKDRDGRPAQRDPTFLAETKIMTRERADKLFPKEATLQGATMTTRLVNPDIPVTVYSEAVATGQYGHKFQATQITSANPFGKQTNFTKPMSEYNKIVIDE